MFILTRGSCIALIAELIYKVAVQSVAHMTLKPSPQLPLQFVPTQRFQIVRLIASYRHEYLCKIRKDTAKTVLAKRHVSRLNI